MNELKVFEKNGQLLTDSREVAKMIGKRHDHLIRDISGYLKVMNDTDPNFGVSDSSTLKINSVDFFIKAHTKMILAASFPATS